MTERMDNGHETDGVELEIERALAEREDAVTEALAQGDARTPEELAFLDGLRSEWLGAHESAPPAGNGVLIPSPFGGRKRRPRLHIWAPMAAAAAVLFGVWLGGGLSGSNTDGNGSGTPDSGSRGPSGVYLGGGDETEQVFDGTVDWSEHVAETGSYELVVHDADAALPGEASTLIRVPLFTGSHWTFTSQELDKLTSRFTVEVFDLIAPAGSAAVWTGHYRLP